MSQREELLKLVAIAFAKANYDEPLDHLDESSARSCRTDAVIALNALEPYLVPARPETGRSEAAREAVVSLLARAIAGEDGPTRFERRDAEEIVDLVTEHAVETFRALLDAERRAHPLVTVEAP
jgi:hypothetical protein